MNPRLPLGQKILGALIVITLLAISASTIFIAQSAVRDANARFTSGAPSQSIAIAQRDALVYVIRLEQWSFGLKERREVQIARGILAQRLNVLDSRGKSPGDLSTPEFLAALRESDLILESTGPGFLPTELQIGIQAEIVPATEQLIAQSRILLENSQQERNYSVLSQANSKNLLQGITLSLLFLFLMMFIALVFLNRKRTISDFRNNRATILSDTEKLDHLIEELSLSESSVTNLRELSETKSAFMENVNHELRTPLGSVLGYIEVIRDMTDDKPELGISKYLEVVDKNVNILLTLVEDILSLAKLDSKLASLPNISVDIAQVVDHCIIVLQPVCEKSKINIDFSIDRELGYFVQGDAGQLNQVIMNLLSNSIKFSKINSQIEIELGKLSHGENFDAIRIVIRDHGIGIPPNDIDKLFTRFHRGKNAIDKQFPGTGLGLAIVEQIVQLHGGTIRIESVEGEGTTIILELPKHLSPADELVLARRDAVLVRAITDLEQSSKQDLRQVTHSLSGLIGFYTFEEESRLIREFSHWLNSGNLIDPVEVENRRKSILTVLKLRLASLPEREADE